MKVVNFPVCRFIKGGHWYGGRCYDSKDAVRAAMSDRDWRRISQWESRHAERIANQGPQQRDGGGAA